MRRTEAEALRREAAALGAETGDLDRAIARLREFENSAAAGADPRGLDQLQEAIIAGLQRFEFGLLRKFVTADQPALGAPVAVPPEYRGQVEEYYRSLGRRPR